VAVVQIRFGNHAAWHRLMLDHALKDERMTACEKAIPDTYRATREPNYEEPLCRDGCFSPGEIRVAEKLAQAARVKRQAAADAYEAESDARAVEREDGRVRRESERAVSRTITRDEDEP
jgi:hypothetical protein